MTLDAAKECVQPPTRGAASLDGRVAIVTGAGDGIGYAAAAALARRGAHVVLTGTRAALIEESAAGLRAAGLQAEAIPMDLHDAGSISALIDGTAARHGRLDILHNNAADLSKTGEDLDAEAMSLDAWDMAFGVNLRGAMLCCRHALPHMVRAGGGSIINTASAVAANASPIMTAYGASKAALVHLTRSIATSHGKRGIRCNAVLPGLVRTEGALRTLPQFLWALQEAENLTPYVGEAADIGHIVAFLASDESRYITGQAILADGGSNVHIAGFARLNELSRGKP